MTYHDCFWIDHREAKVFGVRPDGADRQVIANHQPRHHIRRKADLVDLGMHPLARGGRAGGAAAPRPATCNPGRRPGKAKAELLGYLRGAFPGHRQADLGSRADGYPADGQLLAAVRKYFRAADRMRE